MKKIFSILVASLFCFASYAQVPRSMDYQVLLVNPTNGQVISNKDVNLRMELREGDKVVWSHDYQLTTSKAGVCTFEMNFGNFDWNGGPYRFVTIVDGEEYGASPVNSVPYALKAATLEGMVTMDELIGTWYTEEYLEGELVSEFYYTFHADATAKFVIYDYYHGSHTPDKNEWIYTGVRLLPNGVILAKNPRDDKSNAAMFNVYRYDANTIVMTDDDNENPRFYTKISDDPGDSKDENDLNDYPAINSGKIDTYLLATWYINFGGEEDWFTFKSDGTFIVRGRYTDDGEVIEETSTGRYAAENGKMVLCLEEEEHLQKWNYEVEDSILRVTATDEYGNEQSIELTKQDTASRSNRSSVFGPRSATNR